MEWTNDQKKVIDSRSDNILVSASAGSGKTAVLVARIMAYILQDKVDIDDLLIVTFTRAAAGEMRERIATLWRRIRTMSISRARRHSFTTLRSRQSTDSVPMFSGTIAT